MALGSSTVSAGTDATAAQYNSLRKDVIERAGEYAVAGGTANALTLSVDAQIVTAIASGSKFVFKASATNTAAATININTIGALNLYAQGAAMAGGEIVNGSMYEAVYDGTQVHVLNPTKNKSYVGDLGQTSSSAAQLTSTQDISLSVDVAFVPRYFSAFVYGDAAASAQFNSSSNAGVCRQTAKMDGIIGGAVSYLYVQADQAAIHPDQADPLNPMMGTVVSPVTETEFVGTFGTGTASSPGLPSQTPSSSTSSIVMKSITASGTTITFTWTFTKGDADCGVRIGVRQLVVHA